MSPGSASILAGVFQKASPHSDHEQLAGKDAGAARDAHAIRHTNSHPLFNLTRGRSGKKDS
ncbi:MAG: hypothetical protein HOP33_11225 [Verrucomicrobia bacterium]|nr:hypothetical protein [Verrucomicrobiota bacterium]